MKRFSNAITTCSGTTLVCIFIATSVPALSQTGSNKTQSLQLGARIKFPRGNIACVERDALHLMMDYGARGEGAKMKALMLSNENPDGLCIMLEPQKVYQVVSMEYNNPEIPQIGLLRIVGDGNKSKSGAWVLSVGAEAVVIPQDRTGRSTKKNP